jgi:hypothetical protein
MIYGQRDLPAVSAQNREKIQVEIQRILYWIVKEKAVISSRAGGRPNFFCSAGF